MSALELRTALDECKSARASLMTARSQQPIDPPTLKASLDSYKRTREKLHALRIACGPSAQKPPESSADAPIGEARSKYKVGDRVVSTVDHMPGMQNMPGTVSIVRTKPAYYGVLMDGSDDVHKWLAEDELEPQNVPKAPAHSSQWAMTKTSTDLTKATLLTTSHSASILADVLRGRWDGPGDSST